MGRAFSICCALSYICNSRIDFCNCSRVVIACCDEEGMFASRVERQHFFKKLLDKRHKPRRPTCWNTLHDPRYHIGAQGVEFYIYKMKGCLLAANTRGDGGKCLRVEM